MAHDKKDGPVSLEMIVLHKSPKARLLAENEDVDGTWFPDSQMSNIEVVRHTKGGAMLGKNKITKAPYDGAEIIKFDIPEWLAIKKELV
tara:strand:+ start:760 stop:1026 length:267 start_codon:yes stop_codon:yes gene_type:complete